MTNIQKLALIGAFLLAGTTSQGAIIAGDVLVFDIGRTNADVAGAETVGNWNNVTGTAGAAASDITDAIRFSDGAGTDVGFRILAQEGGLSGIGGAVVGAPATTAGLSFVGSGAIPTSAIQDVAFLSNQSLGSSADSTNGFTFTGLDDSLTYTVSWISSINAARDTLTWSVGGNNVDIDPEDNSTVYSFSGLSSSAGVLTVSIDIDQVTNGETAHLNAVELVAIPEPSTFALVGIALGAVFFVRRRK